MAYNPRKGSLLSECSLTDTAGHLEYKENEPNFGLLFDIDGVLARGLNPIKEAQTAFKLLCNNKGELAVPVAFVTNGCSDSKKKVTDLSSWFNVNFSPDQVIQAPTPLSSFKLWHNKRILFIGQDNVEKIAYDLGFTNVVLIEEVKKAYPFLDVVDHATRKALAGGYTMTKMEKIDAIILIGEPVLWETHLQLIIDLLISDGKPTLEATPFPEKHLPILACNMDLVFMAEAPMPRFGHGAFLCCLESLYERITGNRLIYTALIGKPSEITYRYAEHILSVTARRMGITRPLEKIYFFGDNPEVDILGANLYNNYLRRYRRLKNRQYETNAPDIEIARKASVALSRTVPAEATFSKQTVRTFESILVQTGVYTPIEDGEEKKPHYCHRDFTGAVDLMLPSSEFVNCLEAIQLILYQENFCPINMPPLLSINTEEDTH